MSIETLIANAAAGEPLPTELDFDPALARRHGLGPLLGAQGVPGFEKDLIASALMRERQESDAAEATSALATEGIPVLLIKGVASARRHYDDPAHRPMTDIDLLVPGDAHGEAARALGRLGYWPAGDAKESGRFHHALTLKRPGAAIDLHRSIVQPLRRGAVLDGLWHRAVSAPSDLGGLFPEATDELLITLAHIARHELAVRALSYIDAARMLQHADRAVLEERSRRAKLWRGIEAALALTCALAGSGCPPSLRSIKEQILAREQPSRAAQMFRKLALLESPLEAARLALGAALERVG